MIGATTSFRYPRKIDPPSVPVRRGAVTRGHEKPGCLPQTRYRTAADNRTANNNNWRSTGGGGAFPDRVSDDQFVAAADGVLRGKNDAMYRKVRRRVVRAATYLPRPNS